MAILEQNRLKFLKNGSKIQIQIYEKISNCYISSINFDMKNSNAGSAYSAYGWLILLSKKVRTSDFVQMT